MSMKWSGAVPLANALVVPRVSRHRSGSGPRNDSRSAALLKNWGAASGSFSAATRLMNLWPSSPQAPAGGAANNSNIKQTTVDAAIVSLVFMTGAGLRLIFIFESGSRVYHPLARNGKPATCEARIGRVLTVVKGGCHTHNSRRLSNKGERSQFAPRPDTCKMSY